MTSAAKGQGQAGPRGTKVRSDAFVSVEIKNSGGLQVAINSKVQKLYGEHIKRFVDDVLQTLGLEHAQVQIEDQGALDWVLAARIEAAVRRAGFAPKAPWLPLQREALPDEALRDRLRRSRLYIPGNGPKLMLNAGLYGADALILDLEDSVSPAEKDAARILVRNALRQMQFGQAERMLRINQGQLGEQDLKMLAREALQLILIPKVESAEQVRSVETSLQKLRGQDHGIFLMPIIESARGAFKALEIAEASPAVVALAIGLEDYTADIGTQRTLKGDESFWMRGQVLNAARAAGVQAIDTVFSDIADEDGLRQSVLEAKGLGFEGKGCIHPRQIPVVNQAFAPDEVELVKAQRIVAAYHDAQQKGLGVVALGSKMIDPPVVKRALAQVQLAETLGILKAEWREADLL